MAEKRLRNKEREQEEGQQRQKQIMKIEKGNTFTSSYVICLGFKYSLEQYGLKTSYFRLTCHHGNY